MRVLFIPSSGPKGSGETLHSFNIASELAKKINNLQQKIILSQNSPFIDLSPISVETTPSTPTNHTELVNELIDQFTPNITFFIGAGNRKQHRQCQKVKSKIIYISHSQVTRTRGLRLGRIQYISHHFVDQYDFLLPKLNWLEKIKTLLFPNASPEYIGPIQKPVTINHQNKVFEKFNLENKRYLLVTTGSGAEQDSFGNFYSRTVFDALKEANISSKLKVIQIFGKAYPKPIPKSTDNFQCTPFISPDEFSYILSGSAFALVNGGGTLLESIALGIPTISIAIVGDQIPRVKICSQNKLTVECEPIQDELVNTLKMATKDNFKELNLKITESKNGMHTIVSTVKKELS